MLTTPSSLLRFGLLIAVLLFGSAVRLSAQQQESEGQEQPSQPEAKAEADDSKPKDESKTEKSGAKPKSKPKFPPFSELMKDAKTYKNYNPYKPDEPSLLTLYRKDNKLYGELPNGKLNKDFIILISIARGIGQGRILGGMSWGFGDEWLWQFRRVGDRIHVVRRNVRFTAKKGSPEEKAVELAYTDSVLYSLPIATMGPSGGVVVDLTPVFMSDLPQISRVLPGFSISATKSRWEEPKVFRDNVELEVAATYQSSGSRRIETVADTRGVTIHVHYSISLLPKNGYKPRLADDRVGYFLTAIKDFSKEGDQDRFVRYANRWQLEKDDPDAELSPPKKRIRFYLEKTVPRKYRKPIRDGILAWNRAFEKAGFLDAIEVIDQADDETWDPEDIRYNTFRWITAGAGFAMGPSRVNPINGEILDADIIFDADFIQYWKEDYETFTEGEVASMTGGPLDLKAYQQQINNTPPGRQIGTHQCDLHTGMARQLALGSAAVTLRYAAAPAKELEEKLIMQGLKHIAMHEVGHTLGLRHNFKASTMLKLSELSDSKKTSSNGMVGSVMDYSPAYIVQKDQTQGDFYSTELGPYDLWAIEYGYKPLGGDKKKELAKIASRGAEPQLAYATDEDARGIDPDPLVNRFDLGNDPIEFAQERAALVAGLWPNLVERITDEGQGYQKARRAFGILLGNHGQAMYFAARHVGGLYVSRDHKGDPNARAPFVVVDVNKQRTALKLLEEQVFNDKPFQFPPELYNYLAASRWWHWGTNVPLRPDYPVHDVIAMWQDRILMQLFSSLTLERLHDSELKVPADEDAFTTAELIERVTHAIFAELDSLEPTEYTNRKPAISSLRRNLQRTYLKRLAHLAMGNSFAPQDCQTVAYLQLDELQDRVDKLLEGDVKLDLYTRAHLRESSDRIGKILEARLELRGP